mmetsp:Transcript_1392/g.3229  ORF Transcript_1392/g.3229 Transcript_1392/m.3229 type:complete len:1364 (-) Transcript_1392:538-4629(-)
MNTSNITNRGGGGGGAAGGNANGTPGINNSTIFGDVTQGPMSPDEDIDDLLDDILEQPGGQGSSNNLKRSQTVAAGGSGAAAGRDKSPGVLREKMASTPAKLGSGAAISAAGGLHFTAKAAPGTGFSLKAQSTDLSDGRGGSSSSTTLQQKEATPPPIPAAAKRRGFTQRAATQQSEDSDDDLFLPMGKDEGGGKKGDNKAPTAVELGFSEDSDHGGKKDETSIPGVGMTAVGGATGSSGPRTRRNLGLRLNLDTAPAVGASSSKEDAGGGAAGVTSTDEAVSTGRGGEQGTDVADDYPPGSASSSNLGTLGKAVASSKSNLETTLFPEDDDDDLPIFGASRGSKKGVRVTQDDMALSPKSRMANQGLLGATTAGAGADSSTGAATNGRRGSLPEPGANGFAEPQSARGESPLQKARDNLQGSSKEVDIFAAGDEFLKKPPAPRRTRGEGAGTILGSSFGGNTNSGSLVSTTNLNGAAMPGSTATSVRPSRRQSAEQIGGLGAGVGGSSSSTGIVGAGKTAGGILIQNPALAQTSAAGTPGALTPGAATSSSELLRQSEAHAQQLDGLTEQIKNLKLELAEKSAKTAEYEIKAKRAENEKEEAEAKCKQKMEKEKLDFESERERWELERKRLEGEMERLRGTHMEELRHLSESKRHLTESIDLEKEQVRRNEMRKSREELERVRKQFVDEVGENEKRHQRQVAVIRESTDKELDSVRRSAGSGMQLNSLMEKVHDSAFQLDLLQKKLESGRSVEDKIREDALDAREKQIFAKEKQLEGSSKEVETQRRKMTDLINRMEAELKEQVKERSEREVVANERLEREHARLLELQRSLREEKAKVHESHRDERQKLEEEKRVFERRRADETEAVKNDRVNLEKKEERLKALETSIESARSNCERRIKESEVLIAGERKNLLLEMERFEEKRRDFLLNEERLDGDRKSFAGEKAKFDEEVARVKDLAEKVESRRKQVEQMYLEGCEMREEAKQTHSKIVQDRALRDSEVGRLKALQQMIERQRLELVQDASVRVNTKSVLMRGPGAAAGGGGAVPSMSVSTLPSGSPQLHFGCGSAGVGAILPASGEVVGAATRTTANQPAFSSHSHSQITSATAHLAALNLMNPIAVAGRNLTGRFAEKTPNINTSVSAILAAPSEQGYAVSQPQFNPQRRGGAGAVHGNAITSATSPEDDVVMANAVGAIGTEGTTNLQRSELQNQLQTWASLSEAARGEMQAATEKVLGYSADDHMLSMITRGGDEDHRAGPVDVVLETSKLARSAMSASMIAGGAGGTSITKSIDHIESKSFISLGGMHVGDGQGGGGAGMENFDEGVHKAEEDSVEIQRGRALLASVGVEQPSWTSLPSLVEPE